MQIEPKIRFRGIEPSPSAEEGVKERIAHPGCFHVCRRDRGAVSPTLLSGELQRLAIIAELRMLGTLRRKLSPALQQTVIAEFARDLTKVLGQDLGATIAELGIR